jgi:hypothetical protein
MRAAATVIFFVALGVIDACSSNSMDGGCYTDSDCGSNYLCDDSTGDCYASSDPVNTDCSKPSDCVAGYTCGKAGQCMPGDCFFHGCASGFECESSTGRWECLSSSAGAAGATGNEDAARAGTAGVGESG